MKQLFITLTLLCTWIVPVSSAAAEPAFDTPPLFAYYYIWFDRGSWRRAKTDYPQLGRYSSDDEEVMRMHVRLAKAAGIQGFMVSWKGTIPLQRRLAKLARIAAEEDFKLGIVYQGLDFNRDPISGERIVNDLLQFGQDYGKHPAFLFFDRPFIMISGTWKFSNVNLAKFQEAGERAGLIILGSEKNPQAYLRRAHYFDGNSYYWGAANPDTFPGYEEKLIAMGEAVRKHKGIWIAPAAPGFDARLVGGTSEVLRKDGATYRRELAAAKDSQPDIIGIISWNEFSENTHIEPSVTWGSNYLEKTADFTGQHASSAELIKLVNEAALFDSGSPEGRTGGEAASIAIGSFVLMIVGCLGLICVRRLRDGD